MNASCLPPPISYSIVHNASGSTVQELITGVQQHQAGYICNVSISVGYINIAIVVENIIGSTRSTTSKTLGKL